MSSLFNVGRLDRKFIHESSGSPNERKLKYNDPSFVTFRILFDFEPIVSNDEVMQGLLLNESRDESAISYLRRTGEFERAESLKEFTWLLSKITNDFPWFFKSLSGITGLWEWGFMQPGGESSLGSPVTLTVECYETVDMRMTALADLYRKATRDRRFFRDLLTIDKRRFNMTVIVGEARNLRSFVDSSQADWLNHVSAVAFRCLDCEFDFSKTMPSSIDGTEAPTQISPSFSITVNRVQETNSYLLLNYMLGEIKRDLVIKQGGSGAEVNQDMDTVNYRSLLSPFVRSYEGNYDQVITDLQRNKNQNFINRLTLTPGDRIASLPYQQRSTLTKRELDGISKESELNSLSESILRSIEERSNVTGSPTTIRFGIPTVERSISEPVDMSSTGGPKIEEEVANQIEFRKPKVENDISDLSLQKPSVLLQLDENIGLTKPSVLTEIGSVVDLTKPLVNNDGGSSVDLKKPTVQDGIDALVSLSSPTVQTDLDQSVQFVSPTAETRIDQNISFGRPTVVERIDTKIEFVKPSVQERISEKIVFEKPKVQDDFGS